MNAVTIRICSLAGLLLVALLAEALAGQLPPDINAERYLLQAVQAVRDQDLPTARTAMERLEEVQQEHDLEPAPEDHYVHAQVWEAVGAPERAMASAVRYVQLEGREAEHYTEALALMNRVELREAVPTENICAGQPEGASCWMELESHPGCYIWDPHFSAGEIAAWTGGCFGGFASGSGILERSWEYNDRRITSTDTGLVRDGQQRGRWVEHWVDGGFQAVEEGPYLDGNRHGQWVTTYPHAYGGEEGPYVDGKRNGQWVSTDSFGNVEEGPYLEGKRSGHWVTRGSDGNVSEGPYLEGKRSGHWIHRQSTGYVSEGPYVDDRRHGDWIVRRPDGSTETRSYVNGEVQRR